MPQPTWAKTALTPYIHLGSVSGLRCSFFERIRTSVRVSLSLSESILTTLQNYVTMPTEAELRQLPTFPDESLYTDDEEDMDSFKAATKKEPFWLEPTNACESGALTNGQGGIFLGHNGDGNEVWAHLAKFSGGLYVCDKPYRAMLLLQVVDDKRGANNDGPLLIKSLASLGDVTDWATGILGDNLCLRFRFCYDALVKQACFTSGCSVEVHDGQGR